MKEAAVRATPLTVMTVHELLRGYFGGMNEFPDDHSLAEKAREVVQAEVASVANLPRLRYGLLPWSWCSPRVRAA